MILNSVCSWWAIVKTSPWMMVQFAMASSKSIFYIYKLVNKVVTISRLFEAILKMFITIFYWHLYKVKKIFHPIPLPLHLNAKQLLSNCLCLMLSLFKLWISSARTWVESSQTRLWSVLNVTTWASYCSYISIQLNKGYRICVAIFFESHSFLCI